MSRPEPPPDSRDDRAADRDDAAEHRDDVTHDRDEAADRRDAEATERDDVTDGDDDVTDDIWQTCRQVLDRFARIENAGIDPRDWPDLTPAALAHLDAHTAEQRRLASVDREAVSVLLDQLRHDLSEVRRDRRAAARDRDAAARDRDHSAGNRGDSGEDRDLSARDRDQTAIERVQVDPAHPWPELPSPDEPVPFTERLAASHRRVSDSRDRLDATHPDTARPTTPEP